MNTQGKFYASACYAGHGNFLEPLGFKQAKTLEEADVIIFGGGADIEPATYGEDEGSNTYTSAQREKIEREDFKIGRKLGKKFLGICRGHQLLVALAGGKLIQDASNHGGCNHKITTFDGVEYNTNSIHHQMVNPYNMKDKEDYQILAWSSKRRSNRYLGARDKSILLPYGFKEIESIYLPKIHALGFQYHPEMMSRDKNYEPVLTWTQKTFMKFFNGEL